MTPTPKIKIDLTEFKQPETWDERLAHIRRTFPTAMLGPATGQEAVDNKDETAAGSYGAWVRAFDNDVGLMGRILRDVLKSDQAVPGRPGPRPALDGPRAEPFVDEWMDRDPAGRPYCLMSFGPALTLLAKGKSLNQVARKVNLPRSQVHRLMRGEIVPSGEMMEKVAVGFDKDPSFFIEYRIGTIAAAIVHKLTKTPGASVKTYEALFWQKREELG